MTVEPVERRESAKERRLSTDLREELDGTAWMFPWRFAPGVETPLLGPQLPSIHRSRVEMMEARVRRVLNEAGPGATVLDLACCEGWFSHKMLEWGASRVVGVDIRELNVRRAKLVRQHFDISPERFDIRHGDVLELDPDELGRFDVVLVLGLVYHMERPIDALRLARRVARSLCVVESQLTRQDRPVAWGISPRHVHTGSSFAMYVEPDSEDNQLASTTGIASLIPNRAALEEMARVAGFTEVEFGVPQADHDRQYLVGDRGLIMAS